MAFPSDESSVLTDDRGEGSKGQEEGTGVKGVWKNREAERGKSNEIWYK